MFELLTIIYMLFLAGPLFANMQTLNRFAKKGSRLSDIWTADLKNNTIKLIILILIGQFFGFSYYFTTMIFTTLSVLFAWAILAVIFYYIRHINSSKWIWIFYHIGQVLSVLFSLVLADYMANYQDHVSYNWFDYLSLSGVTLFYLTIAVLFCSAGVGLLAYLLRPKYIKKQKKSFFKHLNKKPSRNMLEHYQAAGLTKQEIEAFRSQMADSRKQILNIEANFQATAKMRAIEIRHNIVKVAKNYFKDIVEEPNRRLDASDFLINYLPQLEDLLEKYNEINSHVAKNKQTYLILEKSAQTIDQLSQEIVEDYLSFHSDTYQELEDGLKLADRMLHNETKDRSDLFDKQSKDKNLNDFDMDDPFGDFD
ncbi:5-bromo-4-chloroindolyl phosphate hydrolysis family protein [Facklamia miroungae]|uniref:5-bromo-4-chloroindolyl phosphate hydrolysis protein n=1 Tax=Facklamia miroungae TaxID=120956 RepID=A0A1G7TUK8_9LACT|nr:5-bromo-4-chloroindolyl phosphate hydrolysis family protein [Facklamia miroungae]NKZ29978.1 hypothetical protein [Facklamia miroungae]SDG38987.1 5-bromo-4-chloroindolyl phosphate hydrolysis protein [Facklamia miroungae]